MDDIRSSRIATALAALADIATGRISPERFTEDARWWWNGGLDLPLAGFNDLLAQLHGRMVDGIRVTPGLTMAQDDSVIVEATSDSPLTDGRHYRNHYIFLIHFAGGRIREVREYSDSAHVVATFDLAAP